MRIRTDTCCSLSNGGNAMENYDKSSHSGYRCGYNFVWVPKYCYHVLVKDLKPRLKEILMELCNWLDISIIEGAICSDHLHMYL